MNDDAKMDAAVTQARYMREPRSSRALASQCFSGQLQGDNMSSKDQEDVVAVVRMFNERERAYRTAQQDRDDWHVIANSAEKRIKELECELKAASPTIMTKRVAGAKMDLARDVIAMEFADATAVFVPRSEVDRCTCSSTAMLTDYEATFELINGRWKLVGMVAHHGA